MNETIISNWNNTVGQDDIVFHLGDFCLGGSAEWTKILDRLNGKIYLIMGNHDLKNIRHWILYFDISSVIDSAFVFLSGDPIEILSKRASISKW